MEAWRRFRSLGTPGEVMGRDRAGDLGADGAREAGGGGEGSRRAARLARRGGQAQCRAGGTLESRPGRGMDWLPLAQRGLPADGQPPGESVSRGHRETLLCNHFCWPDFVPQTSFGLARRLDALGMDTQYPCGLAGSLGTPPRWSTCWHLRGVRREAVLGMEILHPAEVPRGDAATQISGVHGGTGMDVVNNLPGSPTRTPASTPSAGTSGCAAVVVVIDFDGKHMPQFDALARATRGQRCATRSTAARSLRRVKPDAGIFVSEDAGSCRTSRRWGSGGTAP